MGCAMVCAMVASPIHPAPTCVVLSNARAASAAATRAATCASMSDRDACSASLRPCSATKSRSWRCLACSNCEAAASAAYVALQDNVRIRCNRRLAPARYSHRARCRVDLCCQLQRGGCKALGPCLQRRRLLSVFCTRSRRRIHDPLEHCGLLLSRAPVPDGCTAGFFSRGGLLLQPCQVVLVVEERQPVLLPPRHRRLPLLVHACTLALQGGMHGTQLLVEVALRLRQHWVV